MKKRVTITLDKDVIKQTKIKAIGENSNLSATIEKLLVEYIESTKKEKQIEKNDF